MDIQRLKYFLEVARQKSFTMAAALCNVSQPSLSQQIKKLEEEVGGALFLRARGSIKLTPLGEAFQKHAQAIMVEVNSAEEFVHRSQRNTQRTVRLGAIPTIAPYLVPGILDNIRAAQPNTRFELIEDMTESLVESLYNGLVDFALMSPPTSIDDESDFLTIAQDELLLTLPENHRLCQEKTVSMEQLRDENIILLENSHCLSRQAEAYCQEAGLTTDVHIRSSQIETLLRLVETGFGLTFTPAIAAHAITHPKVVFRSISSNPCSREIRLVWLPRHIISKSHEAVINSIRQLNLPASHIRLP